ncbi:MAG: L-threonylcarbamoyladenylate synthase [Thermodesulfobacteriota bacterium]|nr:L-threonylcarbamoyladenylate synthase [Thermodesulfobacteriota bacterium]
MVPVIEMDSDGPSVMKAVKIMEEGGVVAYPTETFYGLGADIGNPQALEKIYTIKGRDFSKPISIIIGSREDLARFAKEITPAAEILMDRFWPGGITLLFKASQDVPRKLTAKTGKIGIRLSGNPVATLLARNLSGAITATSANRSGQKECVSVEEVISSIGENLDAVIDGGRTPGGAGSTIVDTTVDPPVVIREGVIPSSAIHSSDFQHIR